MSQAQKVEVIQVKLNLSALDIDGRIALSSMLAKAAPQSAVYGSNPFLKGAADKAVQRGDDLQAAATAAHNAEMKLSAAKAAVVVAEARFDRDVLCLKSAAEATCTTEAELNDLGFNRRQPKAAPEPLTAPESIVAKMGKDKGTMVVQAKRVGRVSTYVAEISPDPIGPATWQSIPGTGVRRTLSGYQSGAQYWVRFRSVRANEESAWSDPVPVVAR